MPPFREGKIEVDRRLDGEMLHALRDAGHGKRINVVDSSYDVPDDARRLPYAGSTADAVLAIARVIPIEHYMYMRADPEIENDDPEDVNNMAMARFKTLAHKLGEEGLEGSFSLRHRLDKDAPGHGFYSVANRAENSLFVVTNDDLPFACASLVVGHSQRTK